MHVSFNHSLISQFTVNDSFVIANVGNYKTPPLPQQQHSSNNAFTVCMANKWMRVVPHSIPLSVTIYSPNN